MANEIRVRSAVLAGTITDNPLLVGATSFNSARLADVPAIGATEHYPVILDPLGVNGAPEIVWITAHTGSATSATITRAREGTTARQHASGTTWYHGPSVNDYIRSVTTAPSGGGLPFDGQAWYHQTEKRLYVSEAGAGVRTSWTTSAGRTGGAWRRNANQSITDSTWTDVSWDAEDSDSDGFLTPTTTTITVPSGLGGLYQCHAYVRPQDSVAYTRIDCRLFQGTTSRAIGSYYSTTPGADDAICSLSPLLVLAAADTIKLQILQVSGGSRNFKANIWLYRIGV